MTPTDFKLLADLLKARSGLVITEDKTYLLDSRLTPVARKHGLADIAALCGALRTADTGSLAADVVEAMTTNESFFFRDITPFEIFEKNVMPTLKTARASQRKIRIWSAACSSGQEPYSLAILMNEARAAWADWKIEILSTDLSEEMIQKAKEGVYSQFEVQRGLPIQLMLKYFKQEGERWRLSDEIRQMVTFRPFNLLDPINALGSFDVIFCRNVLIYFDQETKASVLNAIAKVVAPDGYLFLGGAETTIGLTDAFRPVSGQRGLYAPDGSPALTGG